MKKDRRSDTGFRHLFRPGQVICFEKRREYFPVGSTPASLPARLSNQTTCPFNQSFTCLNDVVLRLDKAWLTVLATSNLRGGVTDRY